jgi:predicted transcriptional regulator
MSVVTYEGRVEHGQIRLKDAVALPEGAQVYVVVTPLADTALDPEPAQIAADVRAGLVDFAAGRVFEIETADDLARLIARGDSSETPQT